MLFLAVCRHIQIDWKKIDLFLDFFLVEVKVCYFKYLVVVVTIIFLICLSMIFYVLEILLSFVKLLAVKFQYFFDYM
jgi:hypothetical protein